MKLCHSNDYETGVDAGQRLKILPGTRRAKGCHETNGHLPRMVFTARSKINEDLASLSKMSHAKRCKDHLHRRKDTSPASRQQHHPRRQGAQDHNFFNCLNPLFCLFHEFIPSSKSRGIGTLKKSSRKFAVQPTHKHTKSRAAIIYKTTPELFACPSFGALRQEDLLAAQLPVHAGRHVKGGVNHCGRCSHRLGAVCSASTTSRLLAIAPAYK